MPPAPAAAALALGALTISGLISLLVEPGPFSPEAATALGLGALVLALVTVTGLLLARGRWSRWAMLGCGIGWITVALVSPLGLGTAMTTVMAAIVITVAAGPWLPRWLRHRPSAEGPPVVAVGVLLSLLATPLVVAILDPAGEPGRRGWLMIGWSLALAFLISRATSASLWLGRLAHAPLVAALAMAMPGAAAAVLIGKAAVESALLWRRDMTLAIRPLLPDPAGAVPIPPELVDPAIMKAAGLDESGRPLDNS